MILLLMKQKGFSFVFLKAFCENTLTFLRICGFSVWVLHVLHMQFGLFPQSKDIYLGNR